MTAFRDVLATIMRMRGVTAALVVDERDGIIIDSTLQFGMRGNVFAALVASLFRKARQSAAAAGLGAAAMVTLEAERGRMCAVGCDGVVLLAVADPRVNLGLLRVALLKARGALA